MSEGATDGPPQVQADAPGRRFRSVSAFEEITKTEPEKSLLEPVKRKGGRNNQGRITTRRQGGGHKRRYRVIDFKRRKDGVPAKVAAIEYDPNRSARSALLHYADGAKAYILAPAGLQGRRAGRVRPRGRHQARQRAPAPNIPTSTLVHNVELKPGRGGRWRSAGSIQLVAKDDGHGVLRLPSGEMRRVPLACRATVGQVGTPTTRTSRAARRAAAAGWASARPCAARP